MIVRDRDLSKSLKIDIDFYLLYGQNTGLIEETINNILNRLKSISKHIKNY